MCVGSVDRLRHHGTNAIGLPRVVEDDEGFECLGKWFPPGVSPIPSCPVLSCPLSRKSLKLMCFDIISF